MLNTGHEIVAALDAMFPNLPPLASVQSAKTGFEINEADAAAAYRSQYHLPQDATEAREVWIGSVRCVTWKSGGFWYGDIAAKKKAKKKGLGIRVEVAPHALSSLEHKLSEALGRS